MLGKPQSKKIPIPRHKIAGSPKPSGKKPTIKAISPAIMAKGSCVRTWSSGATPEAIEATIVVSENGLQWSPNTAPLKTAPIAATTKRSRSTSTTPSVSEKITGIASGMSTPIAPHEVPVENEINAPSIKIPAGNKATGRCPCRLSLK